MAGELQVYMSPEANSLSNPTVFLGEHNICVITRIVIEKFTEPALSTDYAGTRGCEAVVVSTPPGFPPTGGGLGLTEPAEERQSPALLRNLGQPWQLNAVSTNPDVLVKCRASCF